MNVPFRVFNSYFQVEEHHKDQGAALSSVYKAVTQDFQPLHDYTLMTTSNKGEQLVVHADLVERWFDNYYRKDLFFQSIGLDPMGLESFLEAEGFAVDTGKFDYPKSLLDTRLYFSILRDTEEYLGKGATPMESILDALTYMIARRGLNEVHQRFWSDLWTPPGRGRTNDLHAELARRQPKILRAYRDWFEQETDRGPQAEGI